MRFSRVLECWEVHAEGEIGRVVTGGLPPIPGTTMLDRLRHLEEVDDSLRRFCVTEPRGRPNASTVLLLPPTDPRAHAGILIMQPDRTHAMSGSNAICAVTCMLETGMVEMREPETEVVLDTAAGLVVARARCEGGRCREVRLAMPWSWVWEEGVEVEVPELGTVRLDVAFGGVFYALADVAAFGLSITPAEARRLVELGMHILDAAKARVVPEHPERPGLRGLSYLMWYGFDAEGRAVNATVMPPGRLDRSPCGTGSSARLALAFARGAVKPGDALEFHSVIGSRFSARVLEAGEVAGRPAIRPEIAGRGFLFGHALIARDPEDPFGGHLLSDIWGPGVDG